MLRRLGRLQRLGFLVVCIAVVGFCMLQIFRVHSGHTDSIDIASADTAQRVCSHYVLDAWPEDGVSPEWGTESAKRQKGPQPKTPPCVLDITFGCASNRLWVSSRCHGVFSVDEQPTVCGWTDSPVGTGVHNGSCRAGALPAPTSQCAMMIFTTYFTSKQDWQQKRDRNVSFDKIRNLYRSVLSLGLNLTIFHDGLPSVFIQTYACQRIRFEYVDLSEFNAKLGLNDVRFFVFYSYLQKHTELDSVFVLDAFDARPAMNPCGRIRPETIYASVGPNLKKSKFMKDTFRLAGGRYEEWFRSAPLQVNILNAGTFGGKRPVMLELFSCMMSVLSDQHLVAAQGGQEINVNMAAYNYVLRTLFATRIHEGHPVSSGWRKWEINRKDVWFQHK